jgi:hypothetical protein
MTTERDRQLLSLAGACRSSARVHRHYGKFDVAACYENDAAALLERCGLDPQLTSKDLRAMGVEW